MAVLHLTSHFANFALHFTTILFNTLTSLSIPTRLTTPSPHWNIPNFSITNTTLSYNPPDYPVTAHNTTSPYSSLTFKNHYTLTSLGIAKSCLTQQNLTLLFHNTVPLQHFRYVSQQDHTSPYLCMLIYAKLHPTIP